MAPETTPEPESSQETPQAEPSASSGGKSSTGLDENLAGVLCYLLGFLTGIVFLIIEKESSLVRFHAMQSTFTFVGLFVLSLILPLIPLLGWLLMILLPLVTIGLWVLLMYKAFLNERFKLPFVGDLVEQQLAR